MKKKSLIIGAILGLVIVAIAVWFFQRQQIMKQENINSIKRLYIPTGASYSQMLDSIKPLVKDFSSFEKAAKVKGLQKIYPGRYTLDSTLTNEAIVEKLLMGKQDEIEIMLGNYSSIFELAEKMDPILELNKEEIIAAIVARPEAKGIDTLKMIFFLAPETYRFHWTITGKEFVEKISLPLKKYWTEEKKALLRKSGMSEMDALTLASIVQMESYKKDEQPKVAGVYLNRLKIGMKLQADPTVRFAKKVQDGWDLKSKRVYFKDLRINSAYNTYQNTGLPPGPICMPNPSAIDAVLSPEQHDYIFFVADTSRVGYHLFSKNLAEHEVRAQAYRQWANNRNVK